MRAPEAIILGGLPSSGKSEIGQSFAAIKTDSSAVYVPAEIDQSATHDTRVLVGAGLRVNSPYPEKTLKPTLDLKALLHANRADLVVLDDAILSPDNVSTLKRFANILAVCNVTTSDNQLDDTPDTSALDYLRYQQRHPFFELDGTRPVFENVAALRSISIACRIYDMRRPERL